MAQKLGLLALFLTDLPLLVLDEPMSGLDPKARVLLKRQLAADRARGRTILLSARIPADHDQLCDRIAILHEGRLAYVGTPGDLCARIGAPTLESAFLAATSGPGAAAPDGAAALGALVARPSTGRSGSDRDGSAGGRSPRRPARARHC